MDKRRFNKGTKGNKGGRPSKSEELKLIEQLDKVIDREEVIQKLKVMIDDGSNYVKLCFKMNDIVQTKLIPSRVIRKALPSMSMAGFSDASYEIDGERFSFSSTATGVIPTNNQEFQVALHNRVLINHALKNAGLVGDIEVVVTLPVGQFFNVDGARNDELINN